MVCRSVVVVTIPRHFVSLPVISLPIILGCVQLALLSSCLIVIVPCCPPCKQLLVAVVPGAEVVVVSASSCFWGCPVIVIVSSTN